MSFFKRITATVSANIDQAISQIENHDAVIEAALEETRDAAARLKVQVSRIRTETARLRAEEEKLRGDETRWTTRAARVAAEDESRALDCLRRRDECRVQAERLVARLDQNRDIEQRLAANLAHLDERLNEINARRSELRGRELSARGSSAVAGLDRDAALDVDRAFERWDVEVTRTEFAGDYVSPEADTLCDEFALAERDAELRDELKSLLNEQGNQS